MFTFATKGNERKESDAKAAKEFLGGNIFKKRAVS